jgi:hypothetical protein
MGRIVEANEGAMFHHDVFYGGMKNKELFIIGRTRNR